MPSEYSRSTGQLSRNGQPVGVGYSGRGTGRNNPALERMRNIGNLYRQIHRVRFVKTSGEEVVAITVSEASKEECSMSNVDVYRVCAKLGDYSPTVPAQTDALPIPTRPDATGKRHASPPPIPWGRAD